jgi:hypothetical protein
VAAAGLSAQAAVLIILVARKYGLELTPEIAASLVGWVSFGVAYLKRSRPGEIDL